MNWMFCGAVCVAAQSDSQEVDETRYAMEMKQNERLNKLVLQDLLMKLADINTDSSHQKRAQNEGKRNKEGRAIRFG